MAGMLEQWRRSWAWLIAGAIGLGAMELTAAFIGDDAPQPPRPALQLAGYAGPRAIKVGVTTDHACALMADHTVACWGVLEDELGGSSDIPQRVPGVQGATDIELSTGGTRVVFGDHHTDWGVLTEVTSPCKLVGDAVSCNGQIGLRGTTSLVNAGWYSCALRRDQTVWCWGNNDDGQLGDGTTKARYVPRPVEGLDHIVAIRGSDFQMLAMSSTGEVRWWGRGEGRNRTRPELVPELDHATSIALTNNYGCAVVSMGEIKCWGHAPSGILGRGGVFESDRPAAVLWKRPVIESHGVPNGARVVATSRSEWTSCAVLDDGTLWCWGQRPGSQTEFWSRPHQIEDIHDATTIQTNAGFTIVRRDRSVWQWFRTLRPVLRSDLAPLELTRHAQSRRYDLHLFDDNAAAGDDYAFSNDGRHWTASGIRDWTEAEVRMLASRSTLGDCAVVQGDVMCWGENNSGQLGDGTGVSRATPTKVAW